MFLFGKSVGGVTPSGWNTESLPYLMEFDFLEYLNIQGFLIYLIFLYGDMMKLSGFLYCQKKSVMTF
jgi:hypothetical protein